MSAKTGEDLTIDETVEQLPGQLRTTLALLHPADDQLVELTLAMLPLGSRTTLIALGVIEDAPRPAPDAPVAVTLTELGRSVITACALQGLPDDVAHYVTELEAARAQRTTESPSGFVDLVEAPR